MERIAGVLLGSFAVTWALSSSLVFDFILDFTVGLSNSDALALRVTSMLLSLAIPSVTLLAYHAAGVSTSRMTCALLSGATTLLSVLLALPFLYALVPHYPRNGPHELVASLLAAGPTVFVIVAAAPFATRLGLTRWAAPGALLLCAAIVAFAVVHWGEPRELGLPLSATVERRTETDLKEYRHESLRVDRVPRAFAVVYAQSLGLGPADTSATCGPLHGMGEPMKPIWQPPRGADVWTRTGGTSREPGDTRPEFQDCRSLVGWHQGTLRYCLDCSF